MFGGHAAAVHEVKWLLVVVSRIARLPTSKDLCSAANARHTISILAPSDSSIVMSLSF